MLKVIHEALCADSPAVLQGVIFCTDQLDEIGKEKLGMTSLHTLHFNLTLARFDRLSDE